MGWWATSTGTSTPVSSKVTFQQPRIISLQKELSSTHTNHLAAWALSSTHTDHLLARALIINPHRSYSCLGIHLPTLCIIINLTKITLQELPSSSHANRLLHEEPTVTDTDNLPALGTVVSLHRPSSCLGQILHDRGTIINPHRSSPCMRHHHQPTQIIFLFNAPSSTDIHHHFA